MKKRSIFIFIIIVVVIIIISLFFINKKDVNQESNELTDALKIKEEYESLNDSYIKVSLRESNPFVYISNKKLLKLLDREIGLILIGNSKDNKSRNLINVLNYVNTNIIYYIDVDKLNNTSKEKLLELNNSFSGSGILIGVNSGNIIDYYIEESESELSSNKKDELKLKLDEINQTVSGDSCDMEEPSGC